MGDPTVRLNPVTHPTQIVTRVRKRLEERPERARRIPRWVQHWMRRLAVAAILFGVPTMVTAFTYHVPFLLVGGFVVFTGGMSLLSLELLVDAELDGVDVPVARLVERLRSR